MKRKATAAGVDELRASNTQTSLFGVDHLPKAKASQWYTPASLAKQIVEWQELDKECAGGLRVLEPSAGRGVFIEAAPRCSWTAVELDRDNADHLARWADPITSPIERVICDDFLKLSPADLRAPFDLVVMNPPYEDDLDIDFVMHAFSFAPLVVALLRSAFRHGSKRWDCVLRWVDVLGQVELIDRPQFGTGTSGNSPMSDFVVVELRRRKTPRKLGERMHTTVAWWYA